MKNFDWGKWSAIAEILSAVAIVVTLVYLSIRTAQNTQAIMASAARDVARDETAAIELLIDNPELFLAFDSEEISAADAVKVHAFLAVFTRAQENYWAQYKLGVIDEASINRYQRSFSSMFRNEKAANELLSILVYGVTDSSGLPADLSLIDSIDKPDAGDDVGKLAKAA